ncbi:DUF779 domain-containing protein [Microbacterium sp. C23T]
MSDTKYFSRVAVTDAAAALLRQLTAQHGRLMFHQSGGCCDGSAPMCFPIGMFIVGPSDVRLGDLDVGLDDPIEVLISEAQFEYWKYTHLTIDVVPGRGAGFSVEGPTGNRFIIRSRMLDGEELVHFGLGPEQSGGSSPS